MSLKTRGIKYFAEEILYFYGYIVCIVCILMETSLIQENKLRMFR